ncbi:MAG: lipoyl(octanoyl) transferase LipB [Armatimonadetes bacterium]|nr:lipoyl(octanoyl) transferase LipB [Armatimonadota bacterium]
MVWLGRVAYDAAHSLQERLLVARRGGAVPDTLLLLEHPPVVTLGRSSRAEHLLADPGELLRRGIALRSIGRGGDVTFHGPGQLVGYPIVDLMARGRDVHRFLRDLEGGLIHALATFGLSGQRVPGATGVWLGDEKVAAIGVGVRRWVTYHGFALNASVDLSYFRLIVPCGIADRGVTSLARALGRAVSIEETLRPVAEGIAAAFGAQVRWVEAGQLERALAEAHGSAACGTRNSPG